MAEIPSMSKYQDLLDDLFPQAEIPLEAQIKCVQREITFRRRVYARRVSQGRMSEVFADQQIRLMKAVLKTLQELRNADL
jgi:predicted nucleotidyltransferase